MIGLRAAITPRTRTVAFTLASNAVGTLTSARQVVDLAHAAGALAWVDAVHTVIDKDWEDEVGDVLAVRPN